MLLVVLSAFSLGRLGGFGLLGLFIPFVYSMDYSNWFLELVTLCLIVVLGPVCYQTFY